jgi:sortase A
MKIVRPHANILRLLESALWIAGCSALCYCTFLLGHAAITQARLARTFEQTRSVQVPTAPQAETTALVTSKPANLGLVPAPTMLVGRLKIPRIGLSAMILEGTGPGTLRVGLGHIPGTSGFGEPGNVVIAGHRDTFFRPLRRIEAGDEIVLETTAETYHYRVSSVDVVDPSDTSVLQSHEKDELTLVTCYPFSYLGRAPKRFIVHAVLAP